MSGTHWEIWQRDVYCEWRHRWGWELWAGQRWQCLHARNSRALPYPRWSMVIVAWHSPEVSQSLSLKFSVLYAKSWLLSQHTTTSSVLLQAAYAKRRTKYYCFYGDKESYAAFSWAQFTILLIPISIAFLSVALFTIYFRLAYVKYTIRALINLNWALKIRQQNAGE